MMVQRVALVGIILFGLGPLAARFGVVPPVAGFGVFALGGLLGIVTLVWGGISALRGNSSWLAPGVGLVVTAAFLALALPSRSYPPYNDFTTDTDDPPAFRKTMELPANRGRDMTYPGGVVTEAQRRAYPDLQSLDVAEPPGQAFTRAHEAAKQLPNCEIILADRHAGMIEGVAVTSVFRFKDDFVIRVRARDGGSRIDMRSKSRDGRGDIGANAKRIRAYFATLATVKSP